MTRGRAFAVPFLVCLGLTAPAADADVLVHGGPKVISCGQNVKTGVWYQSYSGGPRGAVVTIKSINGNVLRRLRVRATTTWRYFFYTPRCGRRYRVTYTIPGGRLDYTVRVTS